MSRPAVSIRPARHQDRHFVLETTRRLAGFPLPAGRGVEEVIEGESRTLRACFEAPPAGTCLLVAETPDGPAGFAYLEPMSDYFTLETHGHLGILAVAERAEGRGVGRALLEAAEDWARERGWRKLTLNVFETNGRALAVYERFGFEPETRRYVKRIDAP